MDTLKRIEKIIRERAFDKKKPGLKFNPGLALTGVRTTGPRMSRNRRLNLSSLASLNQKLHFSFKKIFGNFLKAVTLNYCYNVDVA